MTMKSMKVTKAPRANPILSTDEKSRIVLLQFGILVFSGFSALMLLFMAVRLNSVAARKTTFAQLVDGSTVYIGEREGNWRSPETIEKFVKSWINLTFTWEGADTNGKLDPGAKARGGDRVPTNAWFAGYMMESEFSEQFLQDLSQFEELNGVFNGNLKSVVYVRYASAPRQIAANRWEIDVLADRFLITVEGQRIAKAFNRTFTLQATDIPKSPLGEDAPKIEKTVYNILSAGMQIIDIKPFEPK